MPNMAHETPRILIVGSQGQLGRELARSLLPLGLVRLAGRQECDITQPDSLRALVNEFGPDVVVNAAAYTQVDKAESEHDLAYAVNATAPQALARLCQSRGALLIHYSTDYVFSGERDIALSWTESDSPAPLSVYGQTKLAGEAAVIESCDHHLVLRTSWVYGALGQNFAKTILRLAQQRDSLRVVGDQYGAPTSAALIADVTALVLARYLTTPRPDFPWGLYHLVAAGSTTWYDYAVHLVDSAQAAGFALTLRPEAIEAIPASAYPTAAQRPANSQLDTRKLQETFGLHLPDWQQSLAQQLPLILQGLTR